MVGGALTIIRKPCNISVYCGTRDYTPGEKSKASIFHRQIATTMSSTKLYIGNLPDGTKEKDVRELFQAFGEVDEVAVMRGYAFVVSY